MIEHVYFIQGVDGGPIKIGRSQDPKRRLRALQPGSPAELRLLCTIPGTAGVESALHCELADWRLHGEWFAEDAPGLAQIIEAFSAPDFSQPRVVELHRRADVMREALIRRAAEGVRA